MKLAIALCLLAACHFEDNLGETTSPAVSLGSTRWAIAIGGTGDDRGLSLATDSIGDVVVVGDNSGPVDFGSVQVTGGGSFVTKRVASDGSERWTVPLQPVPFGRGYADAMSVAVAPDDSIVVIGDYFGAVDFGGQRLVLDEPDPPDRTDMFLAKYSSDGHLQWVHGLSPTGNPSGIAVAVDSSGRIAVAGNFTDGTLTLGTESVQEAYGDADAFIASFDPSGTLVWGHAFHGDRGPGPSSIAVAPNDDVVMVGAFGGPTALGGAVLDADAYQRAFLTRFRSDGLFLSSRALGTSKPGQSTATQVAIDGGGLVLVETIERPDNNHLDIPSFDALRAFDDNNDELWVVQQSNQGSVDPSFRALATTPSGDILSSTWNDGPFDADHPTDVAGSMEVLHYDRSGVGTSSTFGTRLLAALPMTGLWSSAVSPSGGIAFTGYTSGEIDFGLGPVSTHGTNDTDAFVVMVDPN